MFRRKSHPHSEQEGEDQPHKVINRWKVYIVVWSFLFPSVFEDLYEYTT